MTAPLKDTNSVKLIGTIVRDPLFRRLGDDKCVCNFTVLTQIGRAKGYHSVTAWDESAEAARRAGSGAKVLVEGYLKNDSYESNKYSDSDGNPAKMYKTSVVAQSFKVDENAEDYSEAAGVFDKESDDIPF